jgi:hypothetical protein
MPDIAMRWSPQKCGLIPVLLRPLANHGANRQANVSPGNISKLIARNGALTVTLIQTAPRLTRQRFCKGREHGSQLSSDVPTLQRSNVVERATEEGTLAIASPETDSVRRLEDLTAWAAVSRQFSSIT